VSRRVAIPDFVDGDVRSMAVALRTMKQEVETLSGLRQGQSKGAPAVYVQNTSPARSQLNVYKTGDFWINPDAPQGQKLSFYNGSVWMQI
jgi:hypothetical protein